MLADAREGLVAQTQARNRLHAHLVVLAPGYGATAARLVSGPEVERARSLLRRSHGIQAELARAELTEVVRLGRRAAVLERQLRLLVGDDPLLAIPGWATSRPRSSGARRATSPGSASSDAFAMFAGIAPVPATRARPAGSGTTGAATAGSTMRCGPSRPGRRSSTPGPAPISRASGGRARHGGRPSDASSGTSYATSSRLSSRGRTAVRN